MVATTVAAGIDLTRIGVAPRHVADDVTRAVGRDAPTVVVVSNVAGDEATRAEGDDAAITIVGHDVVPDDRLQPGNYSIVGVSEDMHPLDSNVRTGQQRDAILKIPDGSVADDDVLTCLTVVPDSESGAVTGMDD